MERKKIVVRELKPPQEIGTRGAKKVAWKDTEGLEYFTFTNRFFEHIIEGQEVDVDIETTQRPYGDKIYTDLKITELYINNEPVGKKSQGRAWIPNEDSPEKRASIEAQQAADFTTQLWIAGKLDEKTPEVKALRGWLLSKLNATSVYIQATAEKPTEKPKPTKKQAPVAQSQEIEVTTTRDDFPHEESITPAQIDTIQSYINRKINLAGFIKSYGWQVTKKEDLTKGQADHLISDVEDTIMKAERGVADEAKAAWIRG